MNGYAGRRKIDDDDDFIVPDDVEEEDEEEDKIRSELFERNAASLSVTITIGDGKKQVSGREKKGPRPKGKGTVDDAMSTDDDSL